MKAEYKQLVRERAREAIRNLYHNASPSYPSTRNEYEGHLFDSWLSDQASFEIDYIQTGGANGDIGRLARECVASKYKNAGTGRTAARLYAERALIERAKYAPWESMSDYGRLYQWGRGGRTLAPEKLVKMGGGSCFSLREDYFDDQPLEVVTQAIRVLESFNRYVHDWNRSVPEQWSEHITENGLEQEIADHDGKRPYSCIRWA